MVTLPIHSAGEAFQKTRDGTLLLFGKQAAKSAGDLLGATKEVSGAVGGAASATLGSTLALALTLGLTAGVSAGVEEIEHRDHLKALKKFYNEELAAKLGKSLNKVKVEDLEAVAAGKPLQGIAANPVIAEELSQSRKKRNLGVALSAIASVATYLILNALLPGAGEAAAPASGLASAVNFVTHGIVGLATYFGIKAPLHWAGDKLFGVEKQSTHDRIAEIARERHAGKVIGKEEVFSVFVAANPDLADVIRHKYRKSYEDLPLHDKRLLTENLGRLLQVEAITDAINSGAVSASELAFVSIGQASGVPLKEGDAAGKQHGWIGMLKEKWRDITSYLHGNRHQQPVYEAPAQAAPQGTSFAERVGRKTTPEMSHLERLEQARGENPTVQR